MESNEKKSKGKSNTTDQEHRQERQPSGFIFKRSEDFESLYANNVRFESSVWDIKLLFGVLDQSSEPGTELVEFNTAMSLPWATAKLMAHYLQLNIALHELENGKIRINPRVYPTEPPPLAPSLQDNAVVKAGLEISLRMREEFIKDQQAP